MFIYLYCILNLCMKIVDRRNDKANSEHKPTQSLAYRCIDLPCLFSFDIYLSFNMYFTKY